MSRLRSFVLRFFEKKTAAPVAQQLDEAAAAAEALTSEVEPNAVVPSKVHLRGLDDLTTRKIEEGPREIIYKPDNHPNVIEWLATPKASTNILGCEITGIQKVPLQGPRRQSEAQFRQSWNSREQSVEIPEAVIDVGFDQLCTEVVVGAAIFAPLYRNDSGLGLVEDFTRPWREQVKATEGVKGGILALSDLLETHEGMLKDMVEEHAASCRKCWHEDCWECRTSKRPTEEQSGSG